MENNKLNQIMNEIYEYFLHLDDVNLQTKLLNPLQDIKFLSLKEHLNGITAEDILNSDIYEFYNGINCQINKILEKITKLKENKNNYIFAGFILECNQNNIIKAISYLNLNGFMVKFSEIKEANITPRMGETAAIFDESNNSKNNESDKKLLTNEEISQLIACTTADELDSTSKEVNNSLVINDLYTCELKDLIDVYGFGLNFYEFRQSTSKKYDNMGSYLLVLKYIGDNKFQEYFSGTIINLKIKYDNFNKYGEYALAVDEEKISNTKTFSNLLQKEKYCTLKKQLESQKITKNIKDIIKTWEKFILNKGMEYYQEIAIVEDTLRNFQSEDIKPSRR